jgi:hypothetical protein
VAIVKKEGTGMSPETAPNPEVVPEAPKAPQKERRAFRRRPFRARVRIQTDPLGMGPLLEVAGLNISEGGIAFVVSREMKVGKLVVIEIVRQSIGKQSKWEAEVKWIKPMSEKQFHAGCMWRRRLNFTDIQTFL